MKWEKKCYNNKRWPIDRATNNTEKNVFIEMKPKMNVSESKIEQKQMQQRRRGQC